MNRPYMVCHILSALNGKISGSFMGTQSNRFMGGEYARIRESYHANAWLYGTTTTKEFTGYKRPVLNKSTLSVPEGDYVAVKDAELYYISVDTEGEIGWTSSIFKRSGCPDAHVIEVATDSTSKAYLGYLREHGISYILAGKKELDCRLAAEKLYDLFGIETVLICGGGMINWTFMQQGMVDELSLLLTPAADGEPDTPSVFEAGAFLKTSVPVEFELEDVQRLGKNGLRLVYLTEQKSEDK